MAVSKTYIQQLSYNGLTYTKGRVADLLSEFGIACREFPFVKNPEPKDLPTQDWAGEDGLDIYIPQGAPIPVKHYDLEAEFLYKGTEVTMQHDINAFLDFLYGRNDGSVGARLAIYNEYTRTGRKDVVVAQVDTDAYYCEDWDPDAVAAFKIKFTVYDPVTEVVPVFGQDGSVTDLNFD